MERLRVAQQAPQGPRGQGEQQPSKGEGAGQALTGVGDRQGILLPLRQPLGIEAIHRAAPDAGQLMGDPLDAAITRGPFPQQLKDHDVARANSNQGWRACKVRERGRCKRIVECIVIESA